MKSTRILSVVACMSLTDIVGAQVRLEWKRNVGKGDRKMRALVRRDDSLRFPLYEVPRDTLGWSQGSIGTPAQDMELVVSMDYSDVVVPELDSQLCKAEKSNCSFAGACKYPTPAQSYLTSERGTAKRL
jgi:hypothetical protein